VLFLTILIGAAVVDILLVALLRQPSGGKFEVVEDTDQHFRFGTDLGEFLLDKNSGEFVYKLNGGSAAMPLGNIQSVEFNFSERWALAQEFLFGIQATDVIFDRYKDSKYTYSIRVVTVDRRSIPVYTASQYHPREFMMTWYINLHQSLMERLGWYTDGFEHSMSTLERLRDAFEDAGVSVRKAHAGDAQ
jgi:hypothetical protein